MFRTRQHAQLAGRADVAHQEIADSAQREQLAMRAARAGRAHVAQAGKNPLVGQHQVHAPPCRRARGASRRWSAGPSHCRSMSKCCGAKGLISTSTTTCSRLPASGRAFHAGDDRVHPSPLGTIVVGELVVLRDLGLRDAARPARR